MIEADRREAYNGKRYESSEIADLLDNRTQKSDGARRSLQSNEWTCNVTSMPQATLRPTPSISSTFSTNYNASEKKFITHCSRFTKEDDKVLTKTWFRVLKGLFVGSDQKARHSFGPSASFAKLCALFIVPDETTRLSNDLSGRNIRSPCILSTLLQK